MAVLLRWHVLGIEYVVTVLTSILKEGVFLFLAGPVSVALLLISELLRKDVYDSFCLIKFGPFHGLAVSKVFLFINIMLRGAFF